MRHDLVISPFGAHLDEMLQVAQIADRGGFDGVWTFDHFSGVVAGKPWSRDPFVTLGAIAAVTERVTLGVLVANMTNRHAMQLASAVNTLQALAGGRVLAGIGAGASPGSRYAVEHETIGRELGSAGDRRAALVDYIASFRRSWERAQSHVAGEWVHIGGVVDEVHDCPPVIIGASGAETIRVAAGHADGVNIRVDDRLADNVAAAREAAGSDDFEISSFEPIDLSDPLGGDSEPHHDLGIRRRTLVAAAPFDLERLAVVADNLGTIERS